MCLKTYLRNMKPEERETFASDCGTTLKYMRLVAYRAKKPNAELCIAIERESGGAVRCEALRPDIDWSFRRAAAGVAVKEACREEAA